MQVMSERKERINDAAIGKNMLEESKDSRSDNRNAKIEIEPLKIKTLADLIGVCREKGYQVYNNKPNIPQADRIRTLTLREQRLYSSKTHHRDDRNPNLLGRSGRFRAGESSIKAGVDRMSFMTDFDSNNVASRMTSALSSYYSRSQATSLLSKQTECDPLADAEEVLQQRIRRQSKRRREKRPGALVDLMIQMSLQRDNTKNAKEPNSFTHTDTTVVSPATTDSTTVPVNVTKSPDTERANGDKTKIDKTKGSNPISDASTVVSNRGKTQNNSKSISEPLQNPKTNNAKNKKGNRTPTAVAKATKTMSQGVSDQKLQNLGSPNSAPKKQIKDNQNDKFARSNTNIETGDKKMTVQHHSSTEKENTGETKTHRINSSSKNKNTEESPQVVSGVSASNDNEKQLTGDNKRKSSNVASNSKDDTGEASAAVGGQLSENTAMDDNISEMVEGTEKTTATTSCKNVSSQQTGTPLSKEDDVMKHFDKFHNGSSEQQATENNDEKVLDEVRIKDGNSTLVLYKVKEQSLLNLGKSSKDVTWNQEKDSQITEEKVNPPDSVSAKTDGTNESKEKSEIKNKPDETKSTKRSPSQKKLTSKANKKSETLSKKAQLIMIMEKVKQTNEECSDLHIKTINLFEEARKSFRNNASFDEPETDAEDTAKNEPDTEPEEETTGEDGDQTSEPDEVQDSEIKEELEPKVESPPNEKKETENEQYFIYPDADIVNSIKQNSSKKKDSTVIKLDTTNLPESNVYIVEAKRIFPQGFENIDVMENKSGVRKRTGKYAVKHVNSKYADIFSYKNNKKVALTDLEKNKPMKRNFKRVGSEPPKSAGALNEKSIKKQEVTESKAESKKDLRRTVRQITFPSVTAPSSKTGKERKYVTVAKSEKFYKPLKQANGFSHEIDFVFSNESKTNKNIASKQKTVRCRNEISKINSYPKFEFKTNNTCRSASFTNREKANVEDANLNEKEDISGRQSAADRTSREKLSSCVPNSGESRATLMSGKSDTSISAAVEIVHSRTSFYKGMLSNGEANAQRGHRVHKLFREIQRIRRQVTSYPGTNSSLDDPCDFLAIDRDSGFLFANYCEPGGRVTKQKTNTDLNNFLYGDYGVYSGDKSNNSNYRRRVKALDSLKQKM